jgi:hypothetical protein
MRRAQQTVVVFAYCTDLFWSALQTLRDVEKEGM